MRHVGTGLMRHIGTALMPTYRHWPEAATSALG
jgi:hypothetical protein